MPNVSVRVEDIGPEPDIFDAIVNSPDYIPDDNQIDPAAETETDANIPEDPMVKAIRTGDPYVNFDILPGPILPSSN